MKTNWPLLAGLRFALAFVVLASHLNGDAKAAPWQWIANLNAYSAVLGFLLISGFSIRSSITRDKENFYSRRFDRIAPVFWCAVLLSLVPFVLFAYNPNLLLNGEMPTLPELVGNFLMLQGLLVKPLSSNLPLWTLATECFFYLCAPLFARMPRRALWCLVGASVAVNAFHPAIISSSVGVLAPASLLSVWLCGWLLYDARESVATQGAVLLVSVAVICLNPQGTALLGAGTVAAVAWLMIHQDKVTMSEKWRHVALYGGELSYPLYVCHAPLLAIAALYGGISPYLLCAAALLTAAAIYHGIDKPYRKARAAQHRATNPAPAPSAHLARS